MSNNITLGLYLSFYKTKYPWRFIINVMCNVQYIQLICKSCTKIHGNSAALIVDNWYDLFSTNLYGFSAALMADTLAEEPSANDNVNLNISFHLAATRWAKLSRRESIIGKSSLKKVKLNTVISNISKFEDGFKLFYVDEVYIDWLLFYSCFR